MSVIVQRAPNDPRPLDDPRIDLSKRLKSNSFYIPNLRNAYKDWPEDVNPHYADLKEALNKRIEESGPLPYTIDSSDILLIGCIHLRELPH